MSPCILVCDDDPLLQDLLEFKLTAQGYDVRLVSDGEQALAAMEDATPNLLVLDAMMPKMDGFETLRRMRTLPQMAHVAVLMLTARRKEDDVVLALNLGANDYLVKPFMPEELLARVKRLTMSETVK